MNRVERWTTLHDRFDPWSPPEKREWRVDRTDRGLYSVHARLNRPFERTPKLLVAGTIGAGKTSELLRLAEARAERDWVVFFDVYDHLRNQVGDERAIDGLAPWEVLVLIGLATIRAARARFEHAWTPALEAELSKTWKALLPDQAQPTVSMGKLIESVTVLASTQAGGLGLAAAGKLAGAVRWDRRIGRSERRPTDQDPRVQAVFNSVSKILQECAKIANHRVLVVLDGLDQIRSNASAASLFVNSALLSAVPCALVVTAPFVMRFDTALHSVRGFGKHILTCEPVLDAKAPDQPDRFGRGLDFFRRLFAARTADLGASEPYVEPAALDQLAWLSGGSPRDFMRLMREAIGSAYDAKATTIDATAVTTASREFIRTLEIGLRKSHIETLQAVLEAPQAPLEDSAVVSELLTTGRLLPYRNGREWFFPHPVVLPLLK